MRVFMYVAGVAIVCVMAIGYRQVQKERDAALDRVQIERDRANFLQQQLDESNQHFDEIATQLMRCASGH